jgi:hypothetical protein
MTCVGVASNYDLALIKVTFTDDDARLTVNLPSVGPTWLVMGMYITANLIR